MKLAFPESPADLSAAFNSALEAGSMQAENKDSTNFWARYELIASEVEDGAVVADWFFNALTQVFSRFERMEISK